MFFTKNESSTDGAITKSPPSFIFLGIFFLLFLPFAYIEELYFPFITTRTVLFLIIVEVLFFALLLKRFPNCLQYWKGALTILLGAQLLLGVISALMSDNFVMSLLGDATRAEGIITYFHFFLFLLLLLIIRNPDQWRELLAWSSIITGVLGFHVILSNIFPQVFAMYGDPSGTMFGNILFASQYFLFHFFVSLHLAFENYGRKGPRRNTLLFIFVSIVLLVAIFILARRGVLIGLFGGILILTFRIKRIGTEKFLWARRIIIAGLCISILGGAVIFANRDRSWIKGLAKRIPLVGQLTANINTIQSRLNMIPFAWESLRERPLFGFGPDRFEIVFTRHYNPFFMTKASDAAWQNRSHNFVVDTVVHTGILGFFLLILFIYFVFRAAKGHPVIFAALFAYYLQALFEPDSFGTLFSFYLLVGYIESSYVNSRAPSPQWNRYQYIRPLVLGASGLITMVIIVGGVAFILANHRLFKSREAFLPNTLPQYLGEMKRALYSARFFPNLRKYYLIAESYSVIGKASTLSYYYDLLPILEELEKEFERLYQENPNDAKLLAYYARNVIHVSRFVPEKKALAEELIGRLEKLSPRMPMVYAHRAELAEIHGEFDKIIRGLEQVVSLIPDNSAAQWNLGWAYLMYSPNKDKAILHLQKAFQLNIEISKEELLKLIGIIKTNKIGEESNFLHEVYEYAAKKFPSVSN